MKKLFCLLAILTICILPNIVSAETFSHDGVNYAVEESNVGCSLDESAFFVQKIKDFYVFSSKDMEKLYKVDANNVCTILGGQDYLDSFSVKNTNYGIDDGKIYKYNEPMEVFSNYIKTADTTINIEKTYYTISLEDEDPSFDFVYEPQDGELNIYYELASFTYPTSIIIDKSLTYYESIPSTNEVPEHFEIVENPIEKDIINYFVKYIEEEPQFIATIDSSLLEDIILDNGHFPIIFGIHNKIFILELDNLIGTTFSHTYDLDENLIDSLENAYYISEVGEDLLLVCYIDGTSKIMTLDYEVLYTFKNYKRAYSSQIIDNTNYIRAVKNDKDVLLFLRSYKEKEKTTHNFDNNDLTFTFSGELEKLSKVKINDVELGTDKYTKASGSTIITLKKDYLKILKKGEYTLKVEYNDGGYASAQFTVPESNPQTLDNIISYILFGGISIIGIVGCIVYFKKKENYN